MSCKHVLPAVLTALLAMPLARAAETSGQVVGPGIVADYKVELQAALRAGLSEGVVEAISACNIEAPEIADRLSNDDIRVGRSSDRLRNPGNAAPDWVVPILQAYMSRDMSGYPSGDSEVSATEIVLSDKRLGYVEPIMMQPVCTACHGENIAPEVMAQIDALYPKDRAVGFKVGELRGVFWVEYPAAQ